MNLKNLDTKHKVAGAGGISAVVLSIALILMNLGGTVDLVGTYVSENVTDYSVKVMVETIENVPNATFYDLAIENTDGVQPFNSPQVFGNDSYTFTSTIVMKPIDNVRVLVYDKDMENIGVGYFKENGKIEYKMKDTEVAKSE